MSREALEEALNDFHFHYKGGYFITGATSKEVIDSLQDQKIQDNDVFIVSYLKSGTIWVQQVLNLIVSEGYRNGTENITIMDRSPWIEYNTQNTTFEIQASSRLFTSHLPYYLMPKELKAKKGKIIYLYRNPKDVLVSFYHYIKTFIKLRINLDWETFFDLFMSGRVLGGSWFDHIKGWYSQKEHYNILFMSYEEMKKDLRSAVLKISKFVDVELDEQAIDVVVEKATFTNMKRDPLANYEFLPREFVDIDNTKHLRKGIVGEWKNIMTVAQNEEFDMVYRRKIGDLPIRIIWDISNEERF